MSNETTWFKSSYSLGDGECLEVAATPATIHIRDSKLNPTGPTLQISPATWTTFLTQATTLGSTRPGGSAVRDRT
ncbi:DUF397 domain-containing protein [Streptomyces sp. NPDC058308]|uniref:DUF397 domain-containing protein n=1 Tax=Streptomyces sp. NPDC058308 TaxID=3346440 RepID=UPI0036E1C2A9